MADQSELNLPTPSARPTKPPRRAIFGGFTRMQLLIGLLALGALVWSMWVTKLITTPSQEHIVSARLSTIVGDYVRAQARSASPPSQVEAEMRRFMASLDHELQSRSARGQIVLVGEAVLTKNVPDITESLASAVYASGVPRPRVASATELQRLANQAMARGPAEAEPAVPPAYIDPMGAAQATSPQFGSPAATVSTFGGPNGPAGQ